MLKLRPSWSSLSSLFCTSSIQLVRIKVQAGKLRVRNVIKDPATSKPADRKLEIGRLLSFAVALRVGAALKREVSRRDVAGGPQMT